MKDRRYTAVIRVNVYAPTDEMAKAECKLLEYLLKSHDDNFAQTVTLSETPRNIEEPRYVKL